MAITRKPAPPATPTQEDIDAAADEFIAGAPDASPPKDEDAADDKSPAPAKARRQRGVRMTRGKGRVQLYFTVTRDMEKQIDAWCNENFTSKSLLMNMALKEFFERHKSDTE